MTKSPRVNVVVTEEQHRLLLDLGALQHRSAASYLRELLDAATPLLRATLPILQASRSAMEDQPDALQKAAQDALEQVVGPDWRQMDLEAHLAALVRSTGFAAGVGGADASESSQSAAAPPTPACRPPYSNTGVRSDQTGNISRFQAVTHG